MSILGWLLMGLIAGAIGKMILPGKAPSGWLWTIGLGIVGALVGGMIGVTLGWGTVNDFHPGSIALAILGSVLVILLYDRFLRGRI